MKSGYPHHNENYPYVAAMAIGCALLVGGFAYLFSDHDARSVNQPAFPQSAQVTPAQPGTTGQGASR
jgi:hypothetical protein